ncbi:hypothetical protein BKA67DRAFT_538420 [Truncatella angustata]|uniref:Uncharacterized protein n=1 Tax=Truncatella angustata TaxID=152316 RepID=A0A9P8ZSI2_9PEZI|nr:uncharacterized protein BKA67DRAFT_538420 [Truncatella angustata]KAH6648380.1 hypothetical protein BKA67DRAFT_538420 [Truncatella angustata]KAH8204818.1 hypothetical protein TruAng_001007 [Truncatella angustata]
MKYSQIATPLLLAGSALAAPLSSVQKVEIRAESAASMISAIAPDASKCTDTASECRTAEQAAPWLITALSTYGIITYGEIAGLLALMAYESGDFQYKHNVSPGRPGQGTVNMQTFDYNLEYAGTFAELDAQVAALGTITTDAQKNQLLALVTDDKYNFGSAGWYYTTKCASVRPELQKGTDAGFAAYMACVGVTVTDERNAYWTRAKQTFGL